MSKGGSEVTRNVILFHHSISVMVFCVIVARVSRGVIMSATCYLALYWFVSAPLEQMHAGSTFDGV